MDGEETQGIEEKKKIELSRFSLLAGPGREMAENYGFQDWDGFVKAALDWEALVKRTMNLDSGLHRIDWISPGKVVVIRRSTASGGGAESVQALAAMIAPLFKLLSPHSVGLEAISIVTEVAVEGESQTETNKFLPMLSITMKSDNILKVDWSVMAGPDIWNAASSINVNPDFGINFALYCHQDSRKHLYPRLCSDHRLDIWQTHRVGSNRGAISPGQCVFDSGTKSVNPMTISYNDFSSAFFIWNSSEINDIKAWKRWSLRYDGQTLVFITTTDEKFVGEPYFNQVWHKLNANTLRLVNVEILLTPHRLAEKFGSIAQGRRTLLDGIGVAYMFRCNP